jgi:type IV secretory pathway protease TraF
VLHDFAFANLGSMARDFEPDTVIQLGQPPRRIDLLTHIDGVEFEACCAQRQRVEVDGHLLSIVGLADFKTHKRAMGRLMDQADLESLEAARKNE